MQEKTIQKPLKTQEKNPQTNPKIILMYHNITQTEIIIVNLECIKFLSKQKTFFSIDSTNTNLNAATRDS